MLEQKIEQKDLKDILRKYLKYWYLFLIGAIISISIAIAYLRWATPMYSANTTLLFKDEKSGGLSESSAFGDLALLNSSKSIDNEIFVLKSRSLMEKVVSDLSLDVTYVMEGQIRDIEIYDEDVPINIIMNEILPEAQGKSFMIYFKDDNSFIIEDGTRETHRFGQSVAKPYGEFTIVSRGASFSEVNKPIRVKFHDKKKIAGGLSSRLYVGPANSKASVVSISITDPIPEKAKDILSQLVLVYDEAAVLDKNQIAAKTVDFIDERLDYLTQELSRVERNVEEYKQENELTDITTQAQQFATAATENRKEVESINIQIEVLRSIENYLKGQSKNQYELVPSTLTITDITLNGLITRFNELQLERERQLRTAHPNNPNILSINEQLDNLRDNILENLKNIKSSLAITRRSLLAKSGFVGDQLQQVPVIERQLIEITRQQATKQALFLYLLQKKEESALSLAATVSNTRVIDPPTFKGPVSPVKTNILAYSLILGLFIPFLGVFLRNMLSNKVESKKEIERFTATPILGEICHTKSTETVVAHANTRTPISEMFRLIRSNLHFSTGGKENRKLLVTSSMSGEGKTFFSINIGTSLAGAGNKVLIMEFDLRRPMVLNRLNLDHRHGLTDYLVGDITNVNDIIYASGVDDNLQVISAGTIPPNPAEIMMNPKVAKLIAEMEERYDYIILDTPPIGKVADALTLNKFVDSSIYVVRYNYTDREQLKIVDDLFVNQKLRNPLIVLNDAKKGNTGNYTYGY